MSVRHCAATTAPRNCCPNCYAEQSHKDDVPSSAVGKQLKQKKSNSLVQLHLPALDLFWANFFVRVQLTSLLWISPGLSSCNVLCGLAPWSFIIVSGRLQTESLLACQCCVWRRLWRCVSFLQSQGHGRSSVYCVKRCPFVSLLWLR